MTETRAEMRLPTQDLRADLPFYTRTLGMRLEMWEGLAATLAESHPVLRYDHRGQGGSAAVRMPYAIDDLVDDVDGHADTGTEAAGIGEEKFHVREIVGVGGGWLFEREV